MKNLEAILSLTLLLTTASGYAQTPAAPAPAAQPATTAAKPAEEGQDWPNLRKYQAANAALPASTPGQPRVVFLGDSITEGWAYWPGAVFFPGKTNYIDRGISGQTTPQILLRFQQDVVRLHPAVVVILAGTNDIAGNTGSSTPEMIEDNFRSMAAIARASNIKVVFASITPAGNYPWRPAIQPVPIIREMNQWLKQFCADQGLVYLDYYSAMADDKGAMKPGLAFDGVHPTHEGYAIMAPLAEAAIAQALKVDPK